MQLCPLNVCNYMYLENEYVLNKWYYSLLSLRWTPLGPFVSIFNREMSFLQMVIKNIASIVRRLAMKAGKTLKLKTMVLYVGVGSCLPVHAQSFFLFTNCD